MTYIVWKKRNNKLPFSDNYVNFKVMYLTKIKSVISVGKQFCFGILVLSQELSSFRKKVQKQHFKNLEQV